MNGLGLTDNQKTTIKVVGLTDNKTTTMNSWFDDLANLCIHFLKICIFDYIML